ncbi:VRR-NUC domain-containing protein [Burkholderia gladioli]|uniref:VRR-NUC domain-containing protein n=1 Tax=Burkholderia gladioli TaxID=28095 RepID=UPI00164113D9|nr:VRR-NUC domain-containing protein [Burkholderia gladioli]
MLEKTVEAYLVERVRALGGTAYKFTSPARASVPDRIVILPPGRIFFVELKRPGGKLTRGQEREHEHLRRLGADVRMLDSIGAINAFLNEVETASPVPGHVRFSMESTARWLEGGCDPLAAAKEIRACLAKFDAAPAAPVANHSPGATKMVAAQAVAADGDALKEAVMRTIDTIRRQLELIFERAPGNFLDKVPVVQSLTAHKHRLEKALAITEPRAAVLPATATYPHIEPEPRTADEPAFVVDEKGRFKSASQAAAPALAPPFKRYNWDGKECEAGPLVFFLDVLEALKIIEDEQAAAPAEAREVVAYTSPDRLQKIAQNPGHVDTMWGVALTNEGENIPLYTGPVSAPAEAREPVGSVRVNIVRLTHEVSEPVLTLSREFEALLDASPGIDFPLYSAPADAGESADATRYRWLQRQHAKVWHEIADMPINHTNEYIDAAIAADGHSAQGGKGGEA